MSSKLLEAQQNYREEKFKADTALKFFASAEERADEMQEWLYSGQRKPVMLTQTLGVV